MKSRGSQHSKVVPGLNGYEGRMAGGTTRLGDSTQYERLSMTNEQNPEDSRRAQTEDDHGLFDANAPLTLSARRSQEHAGESDRCSLGQHEANQLVLNEAATIAVPGIRSDPERAGTAQTPGDGAARLSGTTHGPRRIEGCTCGFSPAGTDPFLISALEEILDAFERSLDDTGTHG